MCAVESVVEAVQLLQLVLEGINVSVSTNPASLPPPPLPPPQIAQQPPPPLGRQILCHRGLGVFARSRHCLPGPETREHFAP
jgi:hypothetical protein